VVLPAEGKVHRAEVDEQALGASRALERAAWALVGAWAIVVGLLWVLNERLERSAWV